MKPWKNPRYWLFRFGFSLSILAFFLVLVLIIPFISSALRIRMATYWNKLMYSKWLPFSARINVAIEGQHHLTNKPVIFVCNHQSEWETVMLCGFLSPIIIVLKRSLLYLPVFGWCLRMVNPIPIDRSSPRDAIKQIIDKGKQRLFQGESILIFPEGTRKPSTEIKTYSRTAAKLAIDSEVPIIPIVHNAGKYWSAGERFKSGTIKMKIGQPMDTNNADVKTLTARIQQWTESHYNEF